MRRRSPDGITISPARERFRAVVATYLPVALVDRAVSVRRRDQFVAVQVGWMSACLLLLAALGTLGLDVFYILSYVGLLLASEFTAPLHVAPTWRRRLRWLLVAGGVGFLYVFVVRVQRILAGAI